MEIKNDKIKVYDFKSKIFLQPDDLKIIKIICENFLDLLKVTVNNQTKKNIKTNFKETVINKFNQIINDFNLPVIKGEMDIDGITGSIYIDFDKKLLIYFIDIFLGGDLKNLDSENELTYIEESLMIKISEKIMRFFEKALPKSVMSKFKILNIVKKIENFEFDYADNMIASIKNEIEINEYSGNITLCMPYFLLEKIIKSNTKKDIEDKKNILPEKQIKKISEIEINCSVIMEINNIKLKDIFNIKTGDCILLNYDINQPFVVKLENSKKFFGALGKVGKNLAVKIIDTYKKKEVI